MLTVPILIWGDVMKIKTYFSFTTLVNEYKQAGNYKVTFNAGHLERSREITSGVYFYRLQSGICRETKKLILMK
ncbi:MAG: hypothetical protein A2499_04700 [Stygiobacter sp. RIFOXYC12_FULL_38_8]|nr:MAG: hypothetical protein A2279_01520 [Stygiobacter sp. RIFOXYA12_FULL_38_9]OGV08462.1 MAG: hypothetical protein A2299_03380 [Stygiobacter sp. RIFOXYB2_FULL_37_11]OGV10128.1 MAG: hypothetical protein A2237_11715 [Stygiobacter sp. RIFOXYA2_FULL_38_8]OGV14719.1 MAG: hypothetical protein A2440_09455 [Stygiobacter sp. RIFOXYC2_FULL_38_25]OGV22256.1 MAG: hypothetical protein A2499_04700 [Stygiobacter sp. RIFOXYC12_FULL_38_8]OGV79212.1 MAG: hypothetical protein A2X65_01825 [Stygiobacter sp. GWF2_